MNVKRGAVLLARSTPATHGWTSPASVSGRVSRAAVAKTLALSKRYQQLRGILDEQLGLEPERATRALYHELLRQR